MEVQDVQITQTQAVTQAQTPIEDPGVYARLNSQTELGKSYKLRKGQQQLVIGRHPGCQVQVDNKLVSGYHVRIYRDEAFRYFIEELSPNGCYVNDIHLKKGDTRCLKHGDEISLVVPPNSCSQDSTMKPFAAYWFKVSSHDTDGGASRSLSRQSSCGSSPKTPKPAGTRSEPSVTTMEKTRENGRMVTQDWVTEHWDTRTVLGRGNFSEVRLGFKVSDGKVKHAVKIIDKKKFLTFQNKRESHLSLNSEASVLMDLDHPNIVRFYEWFETDSALYLVMELIEGGDLLQCILEHGCFSEDEARRLFLQLCHAIKYLHGRDIVHRDLKPENILVTTKDRTQMDLKIADFGLARMNMKSMDCRTFCGTPHYFAPEVINTAKALEAGQTGGYGKQVDMWSLGVILYVLLSGIPPFEEEGLYEQITEGKYEFDVREWTTVSQEAKELVRNLMQVNPKVRLTIQQALDHPWLSSQIPPSPQQQTRRRAREPSPVGGGRRAEEELLAGVPADAVIAMEEAPAQQKDQLHATKRARGAQEVASAGPLGA